MIIDEIMPWLGSARLDSLVRLGDEEWQAIVSWDADYFRGTGSTMEEAIATAVEGKHPVGTAFATRFNGGAEAPTRKAKPHRNVLVELGMYTAKVGRR